MKLATFWSEGRDLTNCTKHDCSLSGLLHQNYSSIGTGFDGAKTNCGVAHCSLGILLMNSSYFAIYFQQHKLYLSISHYIGHYGHVGSGLYPFKLP